MSTNDTMYAVVGIRNLYANALTTLGPLRWDLDDRGDLAEYALADAIERREALDDAIYVTDGNEAGRPEYLVVPLSDAEYVRSGRDGDGSNYDWVGCECEAEDGDCCGECDACLAHMAAADEDYLRKHAVSDDEEASV